MGGLGLAALGTRFMQHVQRDFSDFVAAGLDVRLEHHQRLLGAVMGDGVENAAVLVVGGVDPRRLGEICG